MASLPQAHTVEISQRLAELRRGLLRVSAIHGVLWWVAAAFVLLAAIGLADWYYRWESAIGRWSFWTITFASSLAIIWRFWIGPQLGLRTPQQVAAFVESRYPQWRSRLTTALDFHEHRFSKAAGSTALQQRTLAETLADAPPLAVADYSTRRRLQLTAGAAVIASLIVITLLFVFPESSARASIRALAPWSDFRWPQQTVLAFADESLEELGKREFDKRYKTAVQGDSLELRVINLRGRLPDDLRMEFETPEGRVTREPEVAYSDTDRREYALVSLRLDSGPVKFRAIGGDDRGNRWHTVQVVPPPRVDSFRLRVIAPEYLGGRRTDFSPGVGNITLIAGSTVQILEARSNRDLKSASLVVDGLPATKLQLRRGHRISGSLAIPIGAIGEKQWHFQLVDAARKTNRRPLRRRFEVVADEKPLVQPVGTGGTVTATGVIPLAVSATDDQALRNVSVEWQVEGKTKATTIEILRVAQPKANGSTPPQTQISREIDFALTSLRLEPGDKITFVTRANDWYHAPMPDDQGASRVVRGEAITFNIVTAEAKLAEINRRQQQFVDVLEQLRADVKRMQSQQAIVAAQAQRTGEFRPRDRDTLIALEDRFRDHLRPSLLIPEGDLPSDAPVSLEQQFADLRDELRRNDLFAPELQLRIHLLTADLRRLRSGPFLAWELAGGRLLAELESQSGTMLRATPAAMRELASIATQQQRTVAVLTRMLDLLASWRIGSRIHQLLRTMIADQSAINTGTADAIRELRGGRPSPAQQQLLNQLADRQQQLGKTATKLLSETDRAATDEPTRRAIGANLLQRFRTNLQQKISAARVSELELPLRSGEPGKAQPLQATFLADLKSLQSLLAGGTTARVGNRDDLLADAKKKLAELLAAQDKLLTDVKEGRKPLTALDRNNLSLRQSGLIEKTAAVQQILEDADSRAVPSIARGAREQRNAIRLIERRAQRMPIGKRMQNARDAIEQALREVSRELDSEQRQQAAEQFAQRVGRFASLARQQRAISGETTALHQAYLKEKRWLRSLTGKLRELEKRQTKLVGELQTLAAAFPEKSMLRTATTWSVEDGTELAQRVSLAQKEVSPSTTVRQRQLAGFLEGIGASVGQTRSLPMRGDPDGFLTPLSKVKVLRVLQAELATATGRLNENNPQPALRKRLQIRQQQLVQIAEGVLPSAPPEK